MSRSKSSSRWLKEHFDDAYVQQAQADGLRSRAAYKLEELQSRYRLIRRGMRIVDLGAAPGGWSQLAAEWLNGAGSVIALDVLPFEPLDGVHAIQGDFTDNEALDQLEQLLNSAKVDLVMSDMAPNISGLRAVDQPRAMYLAELALDFGKLWIKEGGTFLCKVFQGEGFDQFLADVRNSFGSVTVQKPKASRPRSREVYVLARGFRP